ncbi:Aste57867_1138 [Aphanomyces stellatus]|uniref:Aste57867_1138 protein n=1 Tax=Aphanomyces stellatus TaxID=120398 RepID=A0A485K7T4_9STRA|nr:hypothetical protein As57867_001137 [Aphanomyces stellatus]VFT78358.1 Aste57867_1138 [Aphanomyces stellatus]
MVSVPIPRPDDPSYNHQYAQINGIRMHFIDVGPRDGVPLVLVHGWPDLWFGWRYQIQALRETYRVIVPDNRGYGETESPLEPDTYGRKTICEDYEALLDYLNLDKAVFIGHDWGGAVVWRMCLFKPDRVLAVASVCTPHLPRQPAYMPMDTFVKFLPSFQYQVLLVQDDTPAFFAAHIHKFFRYLFETPLVHNYGSINDNFVALPKIEFAAPTSPYVSPEDMAYYEAQYKKSGFATSLNWYKTRELDWHDMADVAQTVPHQALFIAAGRDEALPPAMSKGMDAFVPNLTRHEIDHASHWVLVEAPEEVNAMLFDWLATVNAE